MTRWGTDYLVCYKILNEFITIGESILFSDFTANTDCSHLQTFLITISLSLLVITLNYDLGERKMRFKKVKIKQMDWIYTLHNARLYFKDSLPMKELELISYLVLSHASLFPNLKGLVSLITLNQTKPTCCMIY